jgi:hypothetical protein
MVSLFCTLIYASQYFGRSHPRCSDSLLLAYWSKDNSNALTCFEISRFYSTNLLCRRITLLEKAAGLRVQVMSNLALPEAFILVSPFWAANPLFDQQHYEAVTDTASTNR